MKNEGGDQISLDYYHVRMCESREDPESMCNCGFDRAVEKNRKEVIRWIYNYYKTLKQEGVTEKQFIIKFEDFLKKIDE